MEMIHISHFDAKNMDIYIYLSLSSKLSKQEHQCHFSQLWTPGHVLMIVGISLWPHPYRFNDKFVIPPSWILNGSLGLFTVNLLGHFWLIFTCLAEEWSEWSEKWSELEYIIFMATTSKQLWAKVYALPTASLSSWICWAGTYSAQRKVTQTLRLTVSGFVVTTMMEVGRKRN